MNVFLSTCSFTNHLLYHMINWNKEKAKINLVIDAIMFVLFMAIAGLGFLIKFILVAGYKRNALYAGDVDLKFLGLDRHAWGSIHLWMGIILIILLVLHIILHWRLIVCIFSRMIKTPLLRYFIGISLLVGSLILALSPFLVSPEISPLPRRHIHSNNAFTDSVSVDHTPVQAVVPSNKAIPENDDRLHQRQSKPKHDHALEQPEIYGSMTLGEVATRYKIPLQEITEGLNIPETLPDERIGRLRKIYGFEMQDLKDIINKAGDNN